MHSLKIYLLLLLLPSTWLLADARFSAGYSTGKFIALEEGYAEAGFFLPFYTSSNSLSFVDLRTYQFQTDVRGGSGGLGFRHTIGTDVLGGNLYCDFREGHLHKVFQRLGVGFEWFTPCFEIRLNGYFPVGAQERKGRKVVFDNYIGDFFATCRPFDFSSGMGFDMEIGKVLCKKDCFQWYAGMGPYFYSFKRNEHFLGAFGRVELHFNRYISVRSLTSYDRRNFLHSQIAIYLALPLWRCECESQCLSHPVYRNGVIFLDHCCHYNWNW